MLGATGWYVALKGHVFDLRELETQFQVGAVRVIVRNGSYYLRANALDEIPRQASSAAGARAADVVRHANRVMALIVPGYHQVSVRELHFFSADGKVHRVELGDAEGSSDWV